MPQPRDLAIACPALLQIAGDVVIAAGGEISLESPEDHSRDGRATSTRHGSVRCEPQARGHAAVTRHSSATAARPLFVTA